MDRILGQLYGIDDFVIIPETVSEISSRSQCDPFYYLENNNVLNHKLPLFAAPMGGVIDTSNWQTFFNDSINVVIPRTIPIDTRLELMFDTFIAISLNEAQGIFLNKDMSKYLADRIAYICIDIANGHMKKLLDICSNLKEKYGNNIILMSGNIANPKTYFEYAKVGIDYVRCSIGSGNVCTTAANSGIHYPLGSLILECYKNKKYIEKEIKRGEDNIYSNIPYKCVPKIIADGGFKNYDQIIKALALGADYVMLGEIFAKTEEACGELTYDINDKMYHTYYGMSTKKAQMLMGKSADECKTAEGIVKEVPVEYTLKGWTDNFIHYLKSAMSYTNSKNLEEFIGQVNMGINTPMAHAAFYK